MFVVDHPESTPRTPFHPAWRRQLVLFLRGEREFTTSAGEKKRFKTGDWLLDDDMGSKGQTSEEIGEGGSRLLLIGIADEWEGPRA